MDKYNYEEAVYEDVLDYITNNYDYKKLIEELKDRDSFSEKLNDEMWVSDSVTGNASGSYTFNAWQAEEYLCHNLDLLGEALQEFGCDGSYITEKGSEACDVTIRCYLLGQAIEKALDYIQEDIDYVKDI